MATSDTFSSDLSVTVPLSTSDHNTIILKTNLGAKATKITTSLPCWDFEHADFASINVFLSNINWNDTFSSSITVEGCWNSFRFASDNTSNSKLKRVRSSLHNGNEKQQQQQRPFNGL